MSALASSWSRLAEKIGLGGAAPVDNSRRALSPAQVKSWQSEGFALLPGFFSGEEVDAVNRHVDELWANRNRPDNPLVIDIYVYTERQKRVYFRDAPDDARNFPYKLNDIFLESETIRNMVVHERLAPVLAALLMGEPMVFNSLTFERGSQQEYHFDTFYMPPKVKNKMIASWIALEDIHPDAGPLAYYPGSHLIPPYLFSNGKLNAIPEEMPKFREYIAREIDKRGLKPVEFTPKRGDVFIWHAQLFHGGAPIKDMARTRKSVVSHYFRRQEFPVWCSKEIGPGRFHFQRDHQKVEA